MTYLSLYRKHRPRTFADIVGQRHVTQTLANAINEGRIHHAYLFTGPRGTGKTSIARILAKAVNCDSGPTADPCDKCASCVGISDGRSVDVIELDMASHGGVDDARELRERALLAPAAARKKVYILDEVHMASQAAFNALLKLIEEPPSHVLFTMATTDPQKVIPTILSRVQRLDLRRVAAPDVADHVHRLADLEGFTITDDAVDVVVRAGEGSVRDTLSILEQLISFADGKIESSHVDAVLGYTPTETCARITDLLAAGDLPGSLAEVQALLDRGADLRRFVLDLAGYLRDLLVTQVAPDRPDLIPAAEARQTQLVAQASAFPRPALVHALDVLAQAAADLRRGPARLPAELALAKIVEFVGVGGTPAASAPPRRVEDKDQISLLDSTRRDVAAHEAEQPPKVAEQPAVIAEAGSELELIVQRWPAVLEALKSDSRRIHAIFSEAYPTDLTKGVLTLTYQERHAAFHAEQAKTAECADALRKVLQRLCGLGPGVATAISGDVPARKPPEAEVEPVVTPADAELTENADRLLREQLDAQPSE